jgi:hypothetical protein
MPYWTRSRAADVISNEYFEVAERTLLSWDDVPTVILNGRAHGKEEDWRRAAERRLQSQLSNQGASPPLQSAARATAGRMARRAARRGNEKEVPPETA